MKYDVEVETRLADVRTSDSRGVNTPRVDTQGVDTRRMDTRVVETFGDRFFNVPPALRGKDSLERMLYVAANLVFLVVVATAADLAVVEGRPMKPILVPAVFILLLFRLIGVPRPGDLDPPTVVDTESGSRRNDAKFPPVVRTRPVSFPVPSEAASAEEDASPVRANPLPAAPIRQDRPKLLVERATPSPGAEANMPGVGGSLLSFVLILSLTGLMGAISVPNFNRARAQAKMKACVSNMKTIEGAVELYNMENTARPFVTVAELSTRGYLKAAPRCPTVNSDQYTIRLGTSHGGTGNSGARTEISCPGPHGGLHDPLLGD